MSECLLCRGTATIAALFVPAGRELTLTYQPKKGKVMSEKSLTCPECGARAASVHSKTGERRCPAGHTWGAAPSGKRAVYTWVGSPGIPARSLGVGGLERLSDQAKDALIADAKRRAGK